MPALQKEAAWAEERLLGDLQQSVRQNGRVHLHIIDLGWAFHTGLSLLKPKDPNVTKSLWIANHYGTIAVAIRYGSHDILQLGL